MPKHSAWSSCHFHYAKYVIFITIICTIFVGFVSAPNIDYWCYLDLIAPSTQEFGKPDKVSLNTIMRSWVLAHPVPVYITGVAHLDHITNETGRSKSETAR